MKELSRRSMLAFFGTGAALCVLEPLQSFAAQTETLDINMWNLNDLFPSETVWEAAQMESSHELALLQNRKRAFFSTAGDLAAAYGSASDALKRILRVMTYAQLKADGDLSNAGYQENKQSAFALQDRHSEVTAWMSPAVLATGHERIASFVRSTPSLSPFRFQFKDLFRASSHTLSPQEEALLAAAASPLSGPGEINQVLTRSEIPKLPISLSNGEIYKDGSKPISSYARNDRKRIYDGYYGRYTALQETLGATLAYSVRGTVFAARARHFSSSLEHALFTSNIPVSVYQTLVSETNKGLPVLHRYYELQRKAAKVERIHLYDMTQPLASLQTSFTVADARALTLEAVAPLGAEYANQLKSAFASHWMDALPRANKVDGSETSSGAYDVHPYVLLNMTPSYDSVTLFAHEWGHAMHNRFAERSQPFSTYYAPVFLQEIGSTCNEQLLIQRLIDTAKNPESRRFYLYEQMRVIATIFFQNALSAEFEVKIHDLEEKGTNLSGKELTEIYLELMRRYYGPAVEVDPAYGIKWAQNEQFFSPFYQFQYCTSLAAAIYFSESVMNGGAIERKRYLSVLRAGGSDYGFDTLKSAGLDLSIAHPYEILFQRFSSAMDQFEELSV